MSRYIDADKLEIHKFTTQEASYNDMGGAYRQGWNDAIDAIVDNEPTADVRKNVHAQKVIRGGERDGATCWFECSSCHGTVDIEDAYCKHCGAVLEYQRGKQDG